MRYCRTLSENNSNIKHNSILGNQVEKIQHGTPFNPWRSSRLKLG